ncbi:MAG: flagellar M-ring protein FliF [Thermoplasmata archaeon]|nr:MAG: flagellar M-ring protein FliF [Deltaproteobacteria bacterium]RLF57437.1 MAG: flagellar M-ring protein FliF [Thermoplasmata archaeon]
MAENETNGFGQLIQVFRNLPLARMITFAVILSLVAGGFIALVIWTNRPDYQILFSNLDATDASRIAEKLKSKKIPFQLEDGGRAIMVPENQVYQLRLEMASQGLPKGQNVGFEVFDNLPFGTTEFVQKLKYQEALQGELARTIMQFDSVEQARVHIVPVGDSLFVEPDKKATASVVLRLQSGRALDRRQLQGIINLVACAVEGLKPENVTVVDMDGGLLSGGKGEDQGAELSSSQFEYRRKLEKSLENRIRSMLEPVVGSNKVVAKVSADVDFRQIQVSEETFDPDSAVVRSEQRQKEKVTGDEGLPSGSPDLKYDVYQSQGKTAANSKKFEKENSVINYEISKVNKQVISSVGDIKRLSAAVIIDGPYVKTKGSKGEEIATFQPRTRKEMKEFQNMVKKAIGFSETRGDQVSVSNIPFAIEKTVAPPAEAKPGWMSYAKKGMKPLFNVLLVALFFVFALKPFRNWLKQTREYFVPQPLPEGQGVPELGAPSSEQAGTHIKKEQILDLTKTDPEKIVSVIRSWIEEGR